MLRIKRILATLLLLATLQNAVTAARSRLDFFPAIPSEPATGTDERKGDTDKKNAPKPKPEEPDDKPVDPGERGILEVPPRLKPMGPATHSPSSQAINQSLSVHRGHRPLLIVVARTMGAIRYSR